MENLSVPLSTPDTPSWTLYWNSCCAVLYLAGILGGSWLGLTILAKTGLLLRSKHKGLLFYTFGMLPMLVTAMLAPFLADIIVQADIVLFDILIWKSPFTTCDAWKQGGNGATDHLLCLKDEFTAAWRQKGLSEFLAIVMKHDIMKAMALVPAIALSLFTCALIGDYCAKRTDGTAEDAASEEKAEKLNSMA